MSKQIHDTQVKWSKRLLTASVAIPSLFFILLDRTCTEVACVISVLTAISEYRPLRPTQSTASAVIITGLIGILMYFPIEAGNFIYLSSLVLITRSVAVEGISGLLSGACDCTFLVVFLFPLTRAVSLARENRGPLLVLTVLLCFAADGAGLIIGNLIGKKKLCPAVSPAKTVEGFIGALAVTAALGAAVANYDSSLIGNFNGKLSNLTCGAAYGFLLALAGSAGDAVESALKRVAGAKDAGTILPGHGGILDRLDSLAPSFLVAHIWSRGL